MDRNDNHSEDDALPQRQSGLSTGVVVLIVFGIVFAALIICGGIATVLAIPAMQQAREAARREQAQENMRQLGLALRQYTDAQPAILPEPIPDNAGDPPITVPAPAP